ncbi:type I-F CRISPR-associated endoribonuclease Cas6/Csy4 [Neisseriaceae bacterium TC5R-5]|nr:type I-F CRISPR-associated endoribonuclease Cas6/Csy4 [Neisseriaceae bacterium TC5R-5]
MNHYIDIRLKPDAEMCEAELSNKIFTKFHKALVRLSTNQIGISFPEVRVKLGRLFRLHGETSLLHDLQGLDWLGPLTGYCQVSGILLVPDKVQYRVISVRRSNLSSAKLRRLIARGSIDKDGEKRYKVKMLSEGFDNPYIDLISGSTEQVYRKFVKFGELQLQPVPGKFDSYGLSSTATVPWF